MYAVIRSGGKQYEAKPGKVIKLEKMPGAVGDVVTLEDVLLYCDGDQVEVGRPRVSGVTVQGKIVEQDRHAKIIVFKSKRRKDYSKKQGHRQAYTAVRIEGIQRDA